jgi:lipoprotein
MKKVLLLTALFAVLFMACSEDENTPEMSEYVIPENDINSVREHIDLEDNQELVTYSIISKDSIWGLSKEIINKMELCDIY